MHIHKEADEVGLGAAVIALAFRPMSRLRVAKESERIVERAVARLILPDEDCVCGSL